MGKRISIGAYIIISIFAIFLLRLWHLQVIKGKEYKNIAEHNRLRIIKVAAPRGIIYDRNNIALVKNIPSFDISVISKELPRDEQTLSELGNLLGLDAEEIKDKLERSSINPFEPVKLKEDVSWEEVAKVEARRVDFPGLQVDVEVSREYLYGSTASHVIGYLGRLSLPQEKNPDYRDVPKSAFVGQWGIEKIYDKTIRGFAGEKIIEVDAIGRGIRVIRERDAIKGTDLKLTIDIDLQRKTEDALGNNASAVVAIEPDTGDILVLASKPSFDPNLFTRGINPKDWGVIINDPKKPMLNRALQSQYPPGSTFKIITAIAGIEEGVITQTTEAVCRGGTQIGSRKFRCWKSSGHGVISLHRALVESCDVYFYEVGKKLGVDKIAEYALMFRLGSPVGLNLTEERAGIIPSTAWKHKTKNQQWFLGETLNTAIGQGYVTTTPIQMARLIAAVVNGGKFYKLNLLRSTDTKPQVNGNVKLKPETFSIIKHALIGVVAEPGGTAHMLHSNIVSFGGKTGTAQVVGMKRAGKNPSRDYRDHAWFVAFAPAEDPKIAMSVFVEHGGHGSAAAAPIAKRMIEEFYKKVKGEQ
ncbi:MAG: penicillin-binding protein 2 [Nitrospirae bacterium]|nr:penicillin-binding protein 2 [Nitrospirota bacterium]